MTGAESYGIPPDFDPADLAPPARWELLREVRVAAEHIAARVRWSRLIESAPRGDGQPILVLPGVGADDSWTRRLRDFLGAIGYRPVGWELGRNHGNVPRLLPRVVERTEQLCEQHEMPVRLVGWSLGGYLAREVARDRPELVDRVITLGSPIVGGPSYTAAAPAYRRQGYDLGEIRATVLEREERPIAVPVFVVYSRSDGVVAWRACIDTFDNPLVRHYEVKSSHLGLVVAPPVLRLVADLVSLQGRPAAEQRCYS